MLMKKGTKIALDFDGTCVTHEYPKIGKDIGAVPVLKKLVEIGCILNLNTMRSGKELDEAVNWFKENDIKLSGINKDIGQESWTKSPKVYAHLYIDDAGIGAPTKFDESISSRPFIDWEILAKWFSIYKAGNGEYFYFGEGEIK